MLLVDVLVQSQRHEDCPPLQSVQAQKLGTPTMGGLVVLPVAKQRREPLLPRDPHVRAVSLAGHQLAPVTAVANAIS